MNSDIFIYDDNFLDQKTIDTINHSILNSLPYWYMDIGGANTDGIHGIGGNDFKDAPLFVNNIVDFPTEQSSHLKDISNMLLEKFCSKNNVKFKSISRCRANVSMASIDRRHTPPHVDTTGEHYVFIYYVNDSDGNTNLYNEKYDGKTVRTADDLSIFKSITPKAGLGVLFSGKVFHTWQPPFNSKVRCIINMNILIDESETI